jgi:hypothetical protein
LVSSDLKSTLHGLWRDYVLSIWLTIAGDYGRHVARQGLAWRRWTTLGRRWWVATAQHGDQVGLRCPVEPVNPRVTTD